jgi:hypothetical protein
MTPEQQDKALAELDGWRKHSIDPSDPWTCTVCHKSYNPAVWREWEPAYQYCEHTGKIHPPAYRESFDAIIPLIQKQTPEIIACMADNLFLAKILSDCCRLCTFKTTVRLTPAQLCEALLRAHGKWIED